MEYLRFLCVFNTRSYFHHIIPSNFSSSWTTQLFTLYILVGQKEHSLCMEPSEIKNMASYGKITLQEGSLWDLIWSDYWWFIVNNVKVNINFMRKIINKLKKQHLWWSAITFPRIVSSIIHYYGVFTSKRTYRKRERTWIVSTDQ